MSKKKKLPCKSCDGRGHFRDLMLRPEKPCPKCKGTGEQPVIAQKTPKTPAEPPVFGR